MDFQQIIVWTLVALAGAYVARLLWLEVRNLLRPSETGGCPGCGGCDAALKEAGAREAPRPTPLVRLEIRRRPGGPVETDQD